MKNTSVSLGDYYTEFIKAQVRAGRTDRPAKCCGPGCACWKSMILN